MTGGFDCPQPGVGDVPFQASGVWARGPHVSMLAPWLPCSGAWSPHLQSGKDWSPCNSQREVHQVSVTVVIATVILSLSNRLQKCSLLFVKRNK